jgi:transposase
MIKDLHRKGVSVSEIARQTGHDRKTIRKAVGEPLVPERPVQHRQRRKLGPYVEYLNKRIAEGVTNASKLYDEIKAQGYSGCPGHVRDFVHELRGPRPTSATVRFETEPGEQAQVDWGHFGYIDHQGHQRPLYAFIMTLGWSRAMYLEFTVSADAAWWLRCHVHAFRYFGGVPRVVLHDNLKTAVLERDADGTIHWNQRYLDFAAYYGFTPRACQPYRAKTKGKVESGVHYVRINFWLGLHHTGLADLNRQALTWLDNVANLRIHGTTHEVPMQRLPHEGLQPLLGKPDYDTSLVCYRRSTSDCLISYDGNLYSVPAEYHKRQLLVRVTEGGYLLVFSSQGDEIARHRLSDGQGERIVQAAHYQTISAQASKPKRAAAVQTPPAQPAQVDAPLVEARSLDIYQQLAEEALR